MSAGLVIAHALRRANSEHAVTVVMRARSDKHCAEPLSKEGASDDPVDLYRFLERREEGSVA
jgi:hypothetical protein